MIYDNLVKNKNFKTEIENKVTYHFVRGPFVEITGPKQAKYRVEFINKDTNDVLYNTEIQNNCWCKCNTEYFIDWKIKIYQH